MKFVSLIFAVFVTASISIAQPSSQVFNSSGSWVVPSGFTANIFVEVWGGGGGGGAQTPNAKGGGGGGAYANATFTNVPPGTYTVIVGAGGAPGISGGSSNFQYSSWVIAAGGGSTSNEFGGVGGLASNSNGDYVQSGENGNTASGDNGGAGGAGPSGGGAGGAGGIANNGNGGNGSAAGGGGGGKAGPGNGGTSGNGGAGRVSISVFALNPLPIDLVAFSGKNVGNAVELVWSTASERNNEKFQIERSAEGKEFIEIGNVLGSGTTTETNHYKFIDSKPSLGTNYYRLKQIDFDGKYEYSPIVSVLFQKEGTISIYPTLVQSEFMVALPRDAAELTTVKIYSLQGNLVHSVREEGTNLLKIAMHTLTAGQYVVEVSNGNQLSRTLVFKI